MSHRYIRQTILKDFGVQGQQRLANARVLVVGLGGLGIPVVQYLNAMGIGTLGLVEQDVVDITNLQRQVLYAEKDIGRPKLEVILEKLQAQNSTTNLIPFGTFLNRENALRIITDFDVIVDASDNFATRYLINDACIILNKPFVYGALHDFEGQLSVFNYKNGPSYRCLFPSMPSINEIPNCNENGVLGIIPGIVGNLQALEVIKVVAGVGEVLSGKLLLYNGLNNSFITINFDRQPKYCDITNLQSSYEDAICSPEHYLSAEELQRSLDNSSSIQLVDVRAAEEFENYCIPGSVNIPLDSIENQIHKIDLTEKVYLICQSGKRSEIALKNLQEQHPKTVFLSIFGGINQFLATCS